MHGRSWGDRRREETLPVFTLVNKPQQQQKQQQQQQQQQQQHGATRATILNVEVQQSFKEKGADNARKVLCELFIQYCFG